MKYLVIAALLIVISSGFVVINEYVNKTTYTNITNSANDTFRKEHYKGKIIVVSFWASWSKSSRLENKNLVRLYNKYKLNSKVAFVGISLDTDEENWRTAIEEDELKWKDQFCDYKKYESPSAKTYGVSTLPTILIIDKTGSVSLSVNKVSDMETALDGMLK